MYERVVDLTGQTFGRIKVIREVPRTPEIRKKKKGQFWVCTCACKPDKEFVVRSLFLRNGTIVDCGCGQTPLLPKKKKRLLMGRGRTKDNVLKRVSQKPLSYYDINWETRNALHNTWQDLRFACLNPRSKSYPFYGGLGIGLDPEWRYAFFKFRDWSIANGYRHGYKLKRHDPSNDFTPNNCYWVQIDEEGF